MPRKTNTRKPSPKRKKRATAKAGKKPSGKKKTTPTRKPAGVGAVQPRLGAMMVGAPRGGERAIADYNDAQIHAIVEQCIRNATNGVGLPSNMPLGNSGRAQSVRACVNAVFHVVIIVTPADTPYSIFVKVKLALAR